MREQTAPAGMVMGAARRKHPDQARKVPQQIGIKIIEARQVMPMRKGAVDAINLRPVARKQNLRTIIPKRFTMRIDQISRYVLGQTEPSKRIMRNYI